MTKQTRWGLFIEPGNAAPALAALFFCAVALAKGVAIWDGHWASMSGQLLGSEFGVVGKAAVFALIVFELAIAGLLLTSATRRMATSVGLLFVVGGAIDAVRRAFVGVPAECGCLGAVHIDGTERVLMLGAVLALLVVTRLGLRDR